MVTDAKDPRLYKPELFRNGLYGFLKSMLEKGPIFGTYLRSDNSFWGEKVFVCPNCIHATLLNDDEDQSTEFYCKYCYTNWTVKEGRIMLKWTKFDDNGNEIETTLI